MESKKTTTLVVAVVVIVTVAMTVIMAWLGANFPGVSGREAGHGNNYEAHTPMPGELYDPPHETEYPAPNPNYDSAPEGDEDYPRPYYYEEHPGDYTAGHDYTFTPIFTREPLPEHIIRQITGVTFHETTPFGYDYLTYLTITHVNFYGESVIGHLIVAASIGYEVLDIFREIYEGGFPIHSMRLIDYFDASDYLSMAANNSHAFNFRYIAGTTTISRHGFGVAIDINPIQNPYIRGDVIWPAAGAEYLDRSYVRPGMIVPGNVVYNAFMSRGWTWGGYWTWPRDYHHFERQRVMG